MPLILVVDDDFPNRFLLSKRLEMLGIESVEAENGVGAIEMFNLHQPNLVLMDIDMPIMNGIEATRVIKKLNHELPVFGVSGRSRTSTIEPFDEYIEKPYEWHQIEHLLAKHGLFDHSH